MWGKSECYRRHDIVLILFNQGQELFVSAAFVDICGVIQAGSQPRAVSFTIYNPQVAEMKTVVLISKKRLRTRRNTDMVRK